MLGPHDLRKQTPYRVTEVAPWIKLTIRLTRD
jgi:hypothetical protein